MHQRGEHSCSEPHHRAAFSSDVAHRLHHWKERATCLGLCTALHFLLEWASNCW